MKDRLPQDDPNIMAPARMFAVKFLQDLEFLICCPKVEGMGTRNIRTQMGMITLKDMCFKCDILMQGKRSSAFGRLMDSN